MTSILPYIRKCYQIDIGQRTLNQCQIFQFDCLERIGKQTISILISSGLIKSGKNPNNRDISNAIKSFQQILIDKLRIRDKRQLYRIFGKYFFSNLDDIKDQKKVQFQLTQNFFIVLDNLKSKSQGPSYTSVIRSPYNEQYDYGKSTKNNQYDQKKTIKHQPISIIQSLNNYKQSPIQIINTIKKQQSIKKQQKQKSNNIKKQQFNKFNQSSKNINKYQNQQNKNQQYKNQQNNQQFQYDQGFVFQQTKQEKLKSKRKLCQDFFIEIVRYLTTLSSPQGQLTYIWQHLKWQGFQTNYQPFMNQNHQWVCTAKIRFPLSMCQQPNSPDCLIRWKTNKNKRKARQLACMDLLKSLYLEYPEVWMLYKHLKEQKKLVIAPLQQPKDQEQITLINDRINYNINEEKIEKLFKHNKTDIRKKMETISAKAQLNTLLQQLPGRVTSPKIIKRVNNGDWVVPVRIEYKTYQEIQNNKPARVYEKQITFQNTKIAEEEAYMEAIIQLYQANPDLFQKIQSIKLAKNIKDPQKKVPLLRDAIKMKQMGT